VGGEGDIRSIFAWGLASLWRRFASELCVFCERWKLVGVVKLTPWIETVVYVTEGFKVSSSSDRDFEISCYDSTQLTRRGLVDLKQLARPCRSRGLGLLGPPLL
jgi:hypothetical protein